MPPDGGLAPPTQFASDLRVLLVRRAAEYRRVVLLGSDPELVTQLQQAGCEVLVDPGALEEVTSFGPQAVVLFDGAVQGADPLEVWRALVGAVPDAEFLFSFANASSASALVATLCGAPMRGFVSDQLAHRWFEELGLAVVTRDLVVSAPPRLGLAGSTEAALRQLFEQLNPSAGADRLLYVLRKAPARPRGAERESELLSVVLANVQPDPALVERAVLSLARGSYRPVQLVLVTSFDGRRLERLLSQGLVMALDPAVVSGPGDADWATSTNRGIERARGQYLALIDEHDVVAPSHYARLIAALRQSTTAWAVSPPAGAEEVLPPFDATRWLQTGAALRSAFVVDRTRLGPFELTVAEETPAGELALFARLAAVFDPTVVSGPATVERLETTPRDGQALAALATALRGRPLRRLGTLDLKGGGSSPAPGEVPPLRKVLGTLAAQVHSRIPRIDSAIRGAVDRWAHAMGRRR